MMGKEEYRKLDIYKRSVELIKNFTDDVLEGDINRLAFFCLGDLEHDRCRSMYEKYVMPDDLSRGKQSNIKWSFDPDDTALARACYCVLWGHLFHIGEDDEHFIGSRTNNRDISAPYRGDTMNTFNTVLGKPFANIPHRIKMYGLEKYTDIMAQVWTFYRTYHMIGNMILLPNRGEGGSNDGINNKRADYKYGLRDYFDLFLMNIYECQNPGSGKFDPVVIERGRPFRQLMEDFNPEYKELDIKEMKTLFSLEDYFEGDVPKNVLGSSIERFKITGFLEDRKTNEEAENFYTEEEYTKLAITYMDKCTELIHARSMRLVEQIKKEIR